MVATVYKIWMERNNSLWNGNIMTVQRVVQDIKHSVKERGHGLLREKIGKRIKLGFNLSDALSCFMFNSCNYCLYIWCLIPSPITYALFS